MADNNIVRVEFGELANLNRSLTTFEALPPVEDYEDGETILWSDGKYASVLRLQDGAWTTASRYDQDVLRKYLNRRAYQLRRIKERQKVATCQHVWASNKADALCKKCLGATKPARWRACGAAARRPTDADVVAGRAKRYPNRDGSHWVGWNRRVQCMRRAGHNGHHSCGAIVWDQVPASPVGRTILNIDLQARADALAKPPPVERGPYAKDPS